MQDSFGGRIALVTGGGTGIGKSIAKRLAFADARVCIVGRLKLPLEETVHEIQSAGGNAIYIPADMSKPEQVKTVFENLFQTWGHVTLLVNAAGIVGPGSIEDLSVSVFLEVLNINLCSVFLTIQAAIPGMRLEGGGAVVNIASISGMVAFLERSAYCSSKAAVIHLTKEAALELSKDNIRVNSISPGFVPTELSMEIVRRAANPEEELLRRLEPSYPIRRFGTANEIGDAALFLLSDRATWITGTNLVIDGGYTLS